MTGLRADLASTTALPAPISDMADGVRVSAALSAMERGFVSFVPPSLHRFLLASGHDPRTVRPTKMLPLR